MASPTNSQFYRKRSSAPKLKTGCVTCKQRHIKCDERRPACLRCKKAGKTCGGYVCPTKILQSIKQEAGQESKQLQRSSIPSLAVPSLESRAMSFYVRVVAIELAGWQCSSFWSKDVIRIAETDCSVRYALVSLSSFYESIYREETSVMEKQRYGLEFYNLAICSLYPRFRRETSVPTIIVVCIILICTDLLRGEHATAMKHFEGAIGLVKEWDESTSATFSEDELRLTRHIIRPMLIWLNTLPFVLGTRRHTITPMSYASPTLVGMPSSTASTFEDATSAMSDLMHVVFLCTDFWRKCRGFRYARLQNESLLVEQAQLLASIKAWSSKLEASIKHPEFLESITKETNVPLLKCAASSVVACVTTCLLPAESSWDIYHDVFKQIIATAETSLEAPSVSAPRRANRFCFGIGAVPLLQLVSWKCRWPKTRRRAIQALRSAKRREAIFDSENVVNLVTKLMEIEEAGFNLPEGEVPKRDQLPPEEARVHRIDVAPLPPTPEGMPVNFLLRKKDGTTHVRCEYVNFTTMFDSVEILNNAINLIPP